MVDALSERTLYTANVNVMLILFNEGRDALRSCPYSYVRQFLES